MRGIHGEHNLLAVQARSVDHAADADAPVLRFFERHAMVSPPGADCADGKLARGARDFVLSCTVDFALSIMNTGTCAGLYAEAYTGGNCRIRGDCGCECGAACTRDVR